MGYLDGMGLYESARSSPLLALDPLGLWGTGDHEDLTRNSFLRWAKGRTIPTECTEYMSETLISANLSVDLPGFLGLGCVLKFIFNTDPEEHYTRPKNENYDLAETKYRGFLAGAMLKYDRELGAIYGECDTPEERQHCLEALRALGRLSHMWQDFYGHSVPRHPSPTIEPGTKVILISPGSPDNPDPFWGPASYPGEHSRCSEPLEDGAEKEARRNEAEGFVKAKFDYLLTVWWMICACCCGD